MPSEVAVAAIGIMPFHIAMLIAQPRTSRPFTQIQHIVGIGSCHLSGMLKLAIVSRSGGSGKEVLQGVAIIVAIDVFATNFQLMPLSYRAYIVYLESVLRKPFVVVVQHTRIVEWCVLEIRIIGLLLIVLARQGEHIRESEKLALSTRLMLKVKSSVP